jgi:hypothetical protein
VCSKTLVTPLISRDLRLVAACLVFAPAFRQVETEIADGHVLAAAKTGEYGHLAVLHLAGPPFATARGFG